MNELHKLELRKLEEMPNERIFRVLRASYDSLHPREKNLFLHIACLFVGKYTDKLNWIGFQAMDGIDILMNMCLLEAHSPLQMHQLLQEMGRKIVREESWNELGQRCILWNHDDSVNVLREKTGTGNVKSIVLDGSQLSHSYALTMGHTNKKRPLQRVLEWLSKRGNSHLEDTTSMGNLNIVLETDAFAKMHNLEFLKLKCVQLHGDYENFPKRLKCLKWHGSPLQSIPINFAMESLVVLNMKHSSLRYLWDGSKVSFILIFIHFFIFLKWKLYRPFCFFNRILIFLLFLLNRILVVWKSSTLKIHIVLEELLTSQWSPNLSNSSLKIVQVWLNFMNPLGT
ncbi:hypothetical protein NMG60_11032227 [Bertholletia excelsa]